MAIDRTRLFAAAVLLAALSACADQQQGIPYAGGPANFGEANRQTMAAQVIDPTPTYDTLVPETTGTQAAAAIERYRTDKVKVPVRGKVSDVTDGATAAPK
jgi:type IV pilus biogenesis protein CpaD/CtpE